MSATRSDFSELGIGGGPSPARAGHLASRRFLEIRAGGTAARGVIVMGLVLATAATRDHRHVIETQTHALEETDVHGHSDVIISDDPVDYPELQGADLLVACCQWAADAYARILKPDGVLLYDSDLVTRAPRFGGITYALPLDDLARKAAGRSELVPHHVALGAAVAFTGVVSTESVLATVHELELPGSKTARERAVSYGLALDPEEWRRTSW